MNGLSNFKHGVKRTSAMILAALIIASGTEAALISADAAEVTTQTASAASMLSNDDRGIIYADSRTDFRDESIYFLITTRFYDGDTSNNARTSEDDNKAHNPEDDPSWRGDFKGLIDKLDYIQALGFTAIWITPVVENDSGYDYHGYHAYDFSAVDTRYESNGVTYQTLIDACHEKGIKVIQDIVLNHTCNWGERNLLQITNEVYGGGRSSYVMGEGAALDPDNIYHHNGFCGGGDWDNYEAQDRTIADDCFDLETENPTVYNYLVDCYTNYINMGVDAFRVDTVKHISRLTLNSVFVPAFKKAGGDNFYMFGEVCTKGHDVWYREHPPISCAFYTWAEDGKWANCWTNDLATNESLVKEHYTAHNDMNNQPTSSNAFLNGNDYHTPDYSERSGMDVIDFQMHWSFNSANQAFGTALGEDKYFNDSTWNVVYVDSHDYGPDECQTLRYNGGTDAWAENLALMFTFRGIPCVFYGSEIEFQAGKPIDVGPTTQLANTGRAYYGDHIEGNISAVDFTVFDKDSLSGEVKNTIASPLSQQIIRLNRIRQAIPALRKGQYSTEGCSGNIAFKRRYTDSSTDSFVCVAISGNATFSGVPNGTYVDAVTGDVQNVSGGTLTANVSGKGNMKVYVLDTAKTPAPGRVIPNGDYLTDGGSKEVILGDDINPIPPTGISLDKSTLEVTEGKSAALTATLEPKNCNKRSITWTSSNPSVATVAGGNVTGVSKGTATITATTVNGYKATCKVTVKEGLVVKPTGITLNKSSLSLEVGGSDSLSATVTPSDADNKTVTWTSDNTAVATVSGGTVKAVGKGTATITASTFNGITATCTVTVTKPTFQYVDKGFYFEKPSGWGSNINVYFYNKSSDTQVGAAWPGTSMKSIGNNVYSLEYTNTDSNVVMIFNDGSNQSPGQGGGGFAIVDQGYYTTDGYKYTVEPDEPDVDVTSVTLSKTSLSLEKNNTATLTATVAPSNATNKTITWTSSNTSVAKVSSSGVVTAVSAGTATITAKSNNGKTAACKVTVTEPVTTLVNNSTVSSTAVKVGDTVTITGKATGGTSPYQYAFYYKRGNATSWTTKASYGTATSVELTPAYVDTYTVRVDVKDNNGTVVSKTFTITSSEKVTTLVNNSTVSSTSVKKGETVTITGKASGGTGSYQYAFYYKRGNATSWTTKAAYGKATSVELTPAYVDTYTVRVDVKDSNGTVTSKTFTITSSSETPLTNNSTSSATSVIVGKSVTITGAAAGGSGSYQYAFYYKRGDATSWTTKSAYGKATSVTLSPVYEDTYYVMINVKDSAGTVKSKIITITSSKAAALVNNSTVSATSVTVGKTVTITGKASGGTSPYQYAFYYKRGSATSWTTKAAYGKATSVTLTPGYVDTYTVRVDAKDSSGTVVSKTFTIKSSSALVNSSTVSATSVTVGKTVTITGKSSGGTGTIQYAFYYKRGSATSWTTKAAYGKATSVELTPAYADTYTVKVDAKDSSGTVVSKTFTIKSSQPTALVNNSSLSSASVTKGTTVTIKGAASGGTGSYTYAYYYKKSDSSQWIVKGTEYGTATSVTLTPGTAINYDIKVVVRDSSGETVTKTFTLVVK